MKKNLYLFDFDGTLTNKDTLFDFLNHSQKNYRKGFLLNMPNFVMAKLGFIPNWKAKEQFIGYFLKRKSNDEIKAMAQRYYEERHEEILRPKALEFIKNLNEDDDKYLVSASLDFWLKPFADALGLRLISTKGNFENGNFSGNFDGPNCNYEEKVRRIQSEINLSDYYKIIAFGDTKGDEAMLNLADEKNFKPFQ